jgi:hypothetical protein
VEQFLEGHGERAGWIGIEFGDDKRAGQLVFFASGFGVFGGFDLGLA